MEVAVAVAVAPSTRGAVRAGPAPTRTVKSHDKELAEKACRWAGSRRLPAHLPTARC